MQGPVVLEAVISRQGTIENLRVLTGHPMSVGAAIDAVIPWRYRSYVLKQRTGRGRDANHGELFSLWKLERDRSFVTPVFKARIMRE
jgi:hypothetical protein